MPKYAYSEIKNEIISKRFGSYGKLERIIKDGNLLLKPAAIAIKAIADATIYSSAAAVYVSNSIDRCKRKMLYDIHQLKYSYSQSKKSIGALSH